MKKEAICEAFCSDLAIHQIPAGLAVKTPFSSRDGDAADFFVVRHEHDSSLYRLEDSGLIVPTLEAMGVTVQQGERGHAFQDLLDEHDAEFDEEALEIHSRYMPEAEIASASLRFVSLLLRLQQLELLKPEKVECAFKEDAIKAISQRFKDKEVELKRDAHVSDNLSNYIVDMLIQPLRQDPPVAVYFATSELKVDEAVILKLESRVLHRDLKVVVLLEHLKPRNVGERALARAQNHIDGMPVFRGYEIASVEKIAEVAGYARND